MQKLPDKAIQDEVAAEAGEGEKLAGLLGGSKEEHEGPEGVGCVGGWAQRMVRPVVDAPSGFLTPSVSPGGRRLCVPVRVLHSQTHSDATFAYTQPPPLEGHLCL